MKFNLKKFPHQSNYHNLHIHSQDAQLWAEGFEKELRDIIEYYKMWEKQAVLNDYDSARKHLAQEILGE